MIGLMRPSGRFRSSRVGPCPFGWIEAGGYCAAGSFGGAALRLAVMPRLPLSLEPYLLHRLVGHHLPQFCSEGAAHLGRVGSLPSGHARLLTECGRPLWRTLSPQRAIPEHEKRLFAHVCPAHFRCRSCFFRWIVLRTNWFPIPACK